MRREELEAQHEIGMQLRDWLHHEIMDGGDPSGKLRDFVESLDALLSLAQRCEMLERVAKAARDFVHAERHEDGETSWKAEQVLMREVDALAALDEVGK